jgi:hypothetical protein
MRNALVGLERLGGDGAKIRSALDDATLTTVECAGPLAWLPIRVNLELSHCVAEVLGEERFESFVQELMRRTYTESTVHRLIHAAIGLLGFDPGSFARLVPHAYGLLFRACGAWRVERVGEAFDGDEAVSTLILEQLPQECVRDRIWIKSVGCSLYALLVVAEADGRVELDSVDEESRSVRFRLSWTPGA